MFGWRHVSKAALHPLGRVRTKGQEGTNGGVEKNPQAAKSGGLLKQMRGSGRKKKTRSKSAP